MLKDTHYRKSIENQICTEWGFECYFASHNSQSRGVAILMNNTFQFSVIKTIKDPNGNFLIIVLNTMNTEITIVNVYGPNRDDPDFYTKLEKQLKNLGSSNIVIAGDWNLVLNPTIDYDNYKHINNPKAKEKVSDMSVELELVDVWREVNPDIQRYTWRRNKPRQAARLDFFLLSESTIDKVKHCDILHGYRSDHSMITLELEFNKGTKRSTYWKFNSSLLYDSQFLTEINKVIKNVTDQYAILLYNRENLHKIPLDEIQFTISDQLFLDVLLMEIRGKTIAYSSHKNKVMREKEQTLDKEIQDLEEKNNKTATEQLQLKEKIESLTNLRESKMQGILIRSKARYASQGERVTKYYCNMEKRHYISKQIFKLVSKQGQTLNSTKTIIEETKEYYKTLYSDRPVRKVDWNKFSLHLPVLNDLEATDLEGLIKLEEASIALKNMSNEKSPGSDGMTVAFF